MHKMIGTIGGQLRRLKIKIHSNAICRPMMSVLCGAVALERMEFEFYRYRTNLITVDLLNEWIEVRRSNGVCSRWALRC